MQLEQGVDAVSSLDLLDGGRTWDILAQHVWRAIVAGQDPLDGVAIAVPLPMEKMIVPLATQRLVNLLLAGFKLAILALGLAVLGLMIPCPIKTECTTTCLLDYGGPLGR